MSCVSGRGSRHRIPFLPVVNAKGAPCGTERYTKNVRLKAPIVFAGNGIGAGSISGAYRVDIRSAIRHAARPPGQLQAIDREARRIGVTRQAYIKLRLADTVAS